MSRHICCQRNYVLCSVINLLYCVLHCSSVSSAMFVLTCLYCAGLCVCVCIACCLLVTLLLCGPLLHMQLHPLQSCPQYRHPPAHRVGLPLPTAKGPFTEMEALTAAQQGMLHVVSLHTSAPHSVVGVEGFRCSCMGVMLILLCVCLCVHVCLPLCTCER